MQTVFLDTNVLLDFLLKREDYAEAREILTMGYQGKLLLYVSSLSFSNIAYITRKTFRGNALYEVFQGLRELVNVSKVDSVTIDKAIALRAADFEDALQYYSALSVDARAVVTNNTKDFLFSEIEVLTPRQFLATVGS